MEEILWAKIILFGSGLFIGFAIISAMVAAFVALVLMNDE